MTELIYLKDAFIDHFEAKVTDQFEDEGVILNQTAFYCASGGQPADLGMLVGEAQTYPVKDVKRKKGQVVHYLNLDELPAIGSIVTGQINWKRRYQLMRTHTAMHVLCGVVWRDYGATVTGGNMEPLKGRMDFEFENMNQDLVSEIEAAINREVEAEHDVKVNFLPRAEALQVPDLIRTKVNLLPAHIEEIRTVEIVGLDLQADGGTHVENTSEVGRLKITEYKSKGKINKRIYVRLLETELF